MYVLRVHWWYSTPVIARTCKSVWLSTMQERVCQYTHCQTSLLASLSGRIPWNLLPCQQKLFRNKKTHKKNWLILKHKCPTLVWHFCLKLLYKIDTYLSFSAEILCHHYNNSRHLSIKECRKATIKFTINLAMYLSIALLRIITSAFPLYFISYLWLLWAINSISFNKSLRAMISLSKLTANCPLGFAF